MKIKTGNCKKCGEQLCIGGMQAPWCKHCEPEKDPTCPNTRLEIDIPKWSKWECHLFGSYPLGGISWRPQKGGVPNRFWRTMQYLIFGNKWIKDKK